MLWAEERQQEGYEASSILLLARLFRQVQFSGHY
jgi:hypothetical protein